ncbi:DUF1127 domain-containing protein [Stappia sp.]|uniref:DUF1127 domain-containing protein n=1 Tax=Stappia sp. TaxID=1870903 RepID=UPI003A99E4DB
MAPFIHSSSARPNRLSIAALAVGGLSGLGQALSSYWRRRRNRIQISELMYFEDHMLADLGITRGDVAASLATSDAVDPSIQLALLRNERKASALSARRIRRP